MVVNPINIILDLSNPFKVVGGEGAGVGWRRSRRERRSRGRKVTEEDGPLCYPEVSREALCQTNEGPSEQTFPESTKDVSYIEKWYRNPRCSGGGGWGARVFCFGYILFSTFAGVFQDKITTPRESC